jgi:hypothetical protein
MKYQYHDLSEAQFEDLAIAVCREILGIGVQGFAQGKDGGRDARFHGKAQEYKSRADLWDGLIIIQAKHTNGINEKFSNHDFFGNKSSVIKKETPKIKALFEDGELDYYMLFSNRKLSALSNEKIINFISDETGLDKSKIVLFGVKALEDFLQYYPKITKYVDINPFEYPLLVEPDELAEIIVAFANNKAVFSEVDINKQIKKSKKIKRTTFNDKNKRNNLSDEYAKLINENMIHYFDDITCFLAQPENDKSKNLYDEVAEEFNMKIMAHKREFHLFDKVLNYLYDFLIDRDGDLKRNKKLTRVFLHYMYYYCDIGDRV